MQHFGYFDGVSYEASRCRRRRWSVDSHGALQGYAAYLHGFGAEDEDVTGGVVAAELSNTEPSWVRPVLIGVVTSAAALIVNRWIERAFFK